MAKPREAAIKITLTALVLIIAFFAVKRIYYSNRRSLYHYSYFRPTDPAEPRYINFLKSKPNPAEIIFSGTSLTAGFPLQQFFNKSHIENMGFGWNKTNHLLRQITKYISRKPSKIFLEAGINDLRYGLSEDSIFNNFVRICTVVKTGYPHTKLYVQSVLPTAVDQLNTHIKVYNQMIEAFCRQNNITYINLYPVFLKGTRIDSDDTIDGIHLDEKGYILWGNSIKQYILP